jgi:hypothetical protein
MKNSKTMPTVGFYNQKADALFAKRIPQINKEIKIFALDLAGQSRPNINDPQILFMPKIKGLFDALLQEVLRIIGAFSVLNQTGEHLIEIYEREVTALKQKKEELLEDVRLIRKDILGLADISHVIRKWVYKWRLVLIALSVGEVAVNFKILLIITPNQLTALVASLGLCTVLFVVAHSLKDLLGYVNSKELKWGVGITIVLGVLTLLWSLNTIRVSYMENQDGELTNISEFSFVIINFSMWIAGAIIALLYKPMKSEIASNTKYKKVKLELKTVEAELKKVTDRLTEIPSELDQKKENIKHMNNMAKHHENSVRFEYRSSVAMFVSENLFRRKDKISPKAFLTEPPKLETYFDHIHTSTKTPS